MGAGQDRVTDDLDRIAEGTDIALAVVRQLLTFSRREPARTEFIDVNRVIREMRNMLGRLLGDSIRLEMHLCVEPVLVKFGAGQLEQVLMNLAANAHDAMPSGGTMTVTTSSPKIRRPQRQPRAVHLRPATWF